MKKTSVKAVAGGVVLIGATGLLAASATVSEAKPTKHAGSISVAAAAFTDDSGDENCRVAKAAFAMYAPDPDAGNVDCDLVAGIQLPDGADLTSLTCSVIDENLGNAMELYLLRVDLATGELEYVFTTAGTVDQGAVQVVGDGAASPGTSAVDNSNFSYYVAAAFSGTDFTNVGSSMRLYGCTVSYE